MANNMESFDFGALDSAALEETLSFLNQYDSAPLPDPALSVFGCFGEPTMDWPVAQSAEWTPLGNAHLSVGMTNSLTDTSISAFPSLGSGWGFENQSSQPHQTNGAEISLDFSQSSRSPKMAPGGFIDITKEPSPQGSAYDNPWSSIQSTNATPLPNHICDWPSCKSITQYATIRELQNHQTDVHIAEILNAWPGSCSWPGCTSKIFFKTSTRLESHVYNIHINPLCCTAEGCRHKKPFERQADLERHVVSKHTNERKYKCPHPYCFRPIGFTRKDKLKNHERAYHGQIACQFNHCIYGFSSKETAQKHLSDWLHHWYECGLGSCGGTQASHFIWSHLLLHLEHDHMIPLEVAREALEKLNYPTKTLTSAQFPNGFSDFQDCEGCAKKLKEATSGKEGKEEK